MKTNHEIEMTVNRIAPDGELSEILFATMTVGEGLPDDQADLLRSMGPAKLKALNGLLETHKEMVLRTRAMEELRSLGHRPVLQDILTAEAMS